LPGYGSVRILNPLLREIDAVHNDRRRRVLDSKTPNQVMAECLEAPHKLI